MATASEFASDAHRPHRKPAAVHPPLERSDSVAQIQRLIQQALVDLRKARRRDDAMAARRAERRMNALVYAFAKRMRTSRLPTTSACRERRER